MKMEMKIDAKQFIRAIEGYRVELEEMKEKEVVDIKRVFEMGLEAGMQLQKAIDNIKVVGGRNER